MDVQTYEAAASVCARLTGRRSDETLAAVPDELGAFAGLSSRPWVALREKWRLEVVAARSAMPPYHAALVAAAHQVWVGP